MTQAHTRCRAKFYPIKGAEIARFPVPNEKVSWDARFPEYTPTVYTQKTTRHTDPAEIEAKDPLPFNAYDEEIRLSRETYTSPPYALTREGLPLNPIGRTGVTGRGRLYRWGPNHAVDPVITRWKKSEDGQPVIDANGNRQVEVVVISRSDDGGWALPGGMIESGDTVVETAKKEFAEEALDVLSHEAGSAKRSEIVGLVDKLLNKYTEIYKGYVDDPRNTDNAWMETVALHFHDSPDNSDGEISLGNLELKAGDDAREVKWLEITPDVELYASHNYIVQKALSNLRDHDRQRTERVKA